MHFCQSQTGLIAGLLLEPAEYPLCEHHRLFTESGHTVRESYDGGSPVSHIHVYKVVSRGLGFHLSSPHGLDLV